MLSKLAADIGWEFSSLLRRDLGRDVMIEIVGKNGTKEYAGNICATHDYCDANVVMAEAFNNLCGRVIELERVEDMRLWSEAWGYAKANNFFLLLPHGFQVMFALYEADKLENYPWIKSVEHLNRVNKYRKRVGQPILLFTDDDMAELILLKGE